MNSGVQDGEKRVQEEEGMLTGQFVNLAGHSMVRTVEVNMILHIISQM